MREEDHRPESWLVKDPNSVTQDRAVEVSKICDENESRQVTLQSSDPGQKSRGSSPEMSLIFPAWTRLGTYREVVPGLRASQLAGVASHFELEGRRPRHELGVEEAIRSSR